MNEYIDLATTILSLRPKGKWKLVGNNYNDLIWVGDDPKPTYEELVERWNIIKEQLPWNEVRQRRNILLSQCDWAVLSDVNMLSSTKQEWLNYRQQLRDITTTFPCPSAVIWPDEPVGSKLFRV